jgi:hypothetical protein
MSLSATKRRPSSSQSSSRSTQRRKRSAGVVEIPLPVPLNSGQLFGEAAFFGGGMPRGDSNGTDDAPMVWTARATAVVTELFFMISLLLLMNAGYPAGF